MTTESLPTVIVPSNRPKVEDYDFVGAQIVPHEKSFRLLLEDGTSVAPQDLWEFILEKEVYVSEEYQGKFDIIYKYLPPICLKHLALAGICKFQEYNIEVRGNGDHLSVRKGNRWGHLSNVHKLRRDAKTPSQVRKAVELTNKAFESKGLYGLRFRSAGSSTQDVAAQLGGAGYQPRPDDRIMGKFLKSFRPARMEGITYGTSYAYDYDISSAYPYYCRWLPTTRGVDWRESRQIQPQATYGAVLCDLQINESLVRGPIAVPLGIKNLWFPVGKIPAVWINMPEVKMLLQYPDLGRITRVHQGYWGFQDVDYYPFRRMVTTLYGMRSEFPWLSPYLKLTLAALWGKMIGQYVVIRDVETGEGYSQAGSLYNPILGSHVTSRMRTDLYVRALGVPVIGEFVDGVTTEHPLESSPTVRLGALTKMGEGPMTLFNDARKTAAWKSPWIRDFAWEQRDKYKIEIPTPYYHTLKTAYDMYGENEMWIYIGTEKDYRDTIRLGSISREYRKNVRYRVGDFLEGQIRSIPLTENEMTYVLGMASRLYSATG